MLSIGVVGIDADGNSTTNSHQDVVVGHPGVRPRDGLICCRVCERILVGNKDLAVVVGRDLCEKHAQDSR
jgi:hypothetical protein